MSVDLSKCKVGDKVQLRDGTIANVIEDNELWECQIFPIVHDEGGNGYHAVKLDGTSCCGDRRVDIVRVLPRHNDRKVAKCIVTNEFGYVFIIHSLGITSWKYSSRNNAIRGARRLCKRIGFECEIVK